MLFRIFNFSLILIASLFISNHAAACSVSYDKNELISEYVAKSDFVFEGTVEFSADSLAKNKYFNRYAYFNIDKIHHSRDASSPTQLDIHYLDGDFRDRDGGFGCGWFETKFETGKKYTIFVRKGEAGFLNATLHSGDFPPSLIVYDPVQMVNYFENGQDSHLFSGLCLQKIKQAYDAETLIGEFKLSDKNCLVAKPYYDREFRKPIETGVKN